VADNQPHWTSFVNTKACKNRRGGPQNALNRGPKTGTKFGPQNRDPTWGAVTPIIRREQVDPKMGTENEPQNRHLNCRQKTCGRCSCTHKKQPRTSKPPSAELTITCYPRKN
jgi:hypothetical protein